MTIATILQDRDGDIVSVTAEATVKEAVALLATRRIGAVPVLEDGRVIGIMSERDVIYGLEQQGAELLDLPVRDVMTAPAIVVTSDMPLLTALSLMTHRRVRHLPVVDGDQMIGFVSIGDLVKARIELVQREAEAMRDYIQSA
jgi:CBS domain-containing protein